MEFATKGLGGARVDEIAQRANINKRMLYVYFGNKEDLFLAVLEEAYADIRRAETKLDLEHLDPVEALIKPEAIATFSTPGARESDLITRCAASEVAHHVRRRS